jgi:hypothetical protein
MHVQHFYENKISGQTHVVWLPKTNDFFARTACGVLLAKEDHVHTNPETKVTCAACIYEMMRDVERDEILTQTTSPIENLGLPPAVQTPLAQFDAAVAKVTTDRGSVYGHPADDFAKATQIKAAVTSCADPLLRHVLDMIGVKMARLTTTPDHMDSWIDIAGYARCAAMVIDRKQSSDLIAREGI